MPIKDHCAVLMVEPVSDRQSRVSWSQYFNYKGLIMQTIFTFMMRNMMNEGIQALTRQPGGAGGSMNIVRN